MPHTELRLRLESLAGSIDAGHIQRARAGLKAIANDAVTSPGWPAAVFPLLEIAKSYFSLGELEKCSASVREALKVLENSATMTAG